MRSAHQGHIGGRAKTKKNRVIKTKGEAVTKKTRRKPPATNHPALGKFEGIPLGRLKGGGKGIN